MMAALLALPAQADEGDRLFALQVKPIFKEKCLPCHGDKPDKIKGDFDMRNLAAMLRGGETADDCLVPGKPNASLIMTAIRWQDEDYEMPPKENDRLTAEQIAVIEKWIRLGAPWPSEARQREFQLAERNKTRTADGILVETSGGLSDEWTYRRYREDELWAFQPVRRPPVPAAAKHPVDAFIQARLSEHKLTPAPPADKRTLIRRLTFDLTGLPPTPEAIAEFLADEDANAYEKLVDRLLASPHYGERAAQFYLDVARYADTGGFSNDFERSNAWRYRDYVIRSFNADKPYDQFIKEQLAGDEIDANNPEMLVATGFLRCGPWGTAMVPQKEARQAFLDDVVHHVGQTFLATAMRCCKCHDHKFDPIPTRDYYGMYAAFATTQPAEREAAFTESENRHGFAETKALAQKLLAFAQQDKQRLIDKREAAARQWYKDNNRPYVEHEIRKDKDIPDHVKPPRHCGLDHVDQGTLKVREQDVKIWTRRMEAFEPMAHAVYNGPNVYYNAGKLRMPEKIKSRPPGKNHVYLGGALTAKGPEVAPRVLSALGLPVSGAKNDETDPYKLPTTVSGRRTALANWIAHPDNPLTTRSIVNRIWQQHFGHGLSRSPNNFGTKGIKPTHPKLLDYLADEFVDQGWSIKRLHKLIVTSATYRQAASHPQVKTLATVDPNNKLLAFMPPRRLTAEELRDAMLAVTGELNPQLGGLPAKPEINMEVALQPRMIQFSLAPAYQPSRTPEQRNRRSIYAYKVRGQPDPFLEVFNAPNPNESCELRDSAAVTPQAFTLMNSELMADRAIAFARRVANERANLPDQLARAFLLATGRPPHADEVKRLTRYVTDMAVYHAERSPATTDYPVRITRSLVEEFSGAVFEYEEALPVFEDYVADVKAVDVTPEIRALADACLILFNTNEFIYVH